jgi:membrane glycosyltransferase
MEDHPAGPGFPSEKRKMWLALERPPGAKNEAYFQRRWSKYRTGERKRGHLNSHCTAWGGAYRASAVYDLSPEDILWLDGGSFAEPDAAR